MFKLLFLLRIYKVSSRDAPTKQRNLIRIKLRHKNESQKTIFYSQGSGTTSGSMPRSYTLGVDKNPGLTPQCKIKLSIRNFNTQQLAKLYRNSVATVLKLLKKLKDSFTKRSNRFSCQTACFKLFCSL